MDQKHLDKKIEKYENKKKTAEKISSKVNGNKKKWTELSFPSNNEKFDMISEPLIVMSISIGLILGGGISASKGGDYKVGMLAGTAAGASVFPFCTMVVGGIRRATQLIADKCYKKFDLKQNQLTKEIKNSEQTSSQELGN